MPDNKRCVLCGKPHDGEFNICWDCVAIADYQPKHESNKKRIPVREDVFTRKPMKD